MHIQSQRWTDIVADNLSRKCAKSSGMLVKIYLMRRDVTMPKDGDLPVASILALSTYACGVILLEKALRAI